MLGKQVESILYIREFVGIGKSRLDWGRKAIEHAARDIDQHEEVFWRPELRDAFLRESRSYSKL
jgi:hypothetical protein